VTSETVASSLPTAKRSDAVGEYWTEWIAPSETDYTHTIPTGHEFAEKKIVPRERPVRTTEVNGVLVARVSKLSTSPFSSPTEIKCDCTACQSSASAAMAFVDSVEWARCTTSRSSQSCTVASCDADART
jgi:hypothetical protein